MEWKEFLAHPEVVEYPHDELPGKYLFLKTLHEIIAGLNGYKIWVITIVKYSTGNSVLDDDQDQFDQRWDIVAKIWPLSSLKDIPDDVQDWIFRWNPLVEKWLSKLIGLHLHYATETADDIDWSALIDMLATVPTEISLQYAEAQTLTLQDDKFANAIVTGLTTCVGKVVHICTCIRDKEYLYLWKYPASES